MSNAKERYEQWLAALPPSGSAYRELAALKDKEDEIEDRFYQELTFGTSGLRGIMEMGTNRMNSYVIGRASQGVAQYLLKKSGHPRCAIAYDTRHHSFEFALRTASVLCANGVEVFLFDRVSPVSSLSYAIRELGLDMGVMITASHNPKQYNGYKVYGPRGYQIAGEEAAEILAEIESLNYFTDVKATALPDLEDAAKVPEFVSGDIAISPQEGNYHLIGEAILKGYVEGALLCGLPGGGMDEIRVVYTPLNGVGRPYVTEALTRGGLVQLKLVDSQADPDSDFTTCPYPNPEFVETYTEAVKTCTEWGGDLIIATDPDCDRVGVAVKRDDMEGGYWYPTGNEIGTLLCNYLCENRPDVEGSTVVRSIVSTPMVDVIAKAHKVNVVKTLTGFKYIGKAAEELGDGFLFGFEEAIGYLCADHVRDKDGVSGALIIVQMAAFYHHRGLDLYDALQSIYEEYGYCRDTSRSFTFEGETGAGIIRGIMRDLREDTESFYPSSMYTKRDYLNGLDGLPQADVLEFVLNEKVRTIIRPSGTEPKIKAYILARGDDLENLERQVAAQKAIVESIMDR